MRGGSAGKQGSDGRPTRLLLAFFLKRGWGEGAKCCPQAQNFWVVAVVSFVVPSLLILVRIKTSDAFPYSALHRPTVMTVE